MPTFLDIKPRQINLSLPHKKGTFINITNDIFLYFVINTVVLSYNSKINSYNIKTVTMTNREIKY